MVLVCVFLPMTAATASDYLRATQQLCNKFVLPSLQSMLKSLSFGIHFEAENASLEWTPPLFLLQTEAVTVDVQLVTT